MSEKLPKSNHQERPIRHGSIDPYSVGLSMPRYDDLEKGKVRVAIHPSEIERQGRTLAEYLNIFGLTKEQLRGKKILDLGAGPHALPAQELQDIAEVYSVSPEYASEQFRVPLPDGVVDTRIAARGEALPFQDNSLDIVWVLHVFEHLDSTVKIDGLTSAQAVFREIIRVLKPGASAYIAPARAFDYLGGINTFKASIDNLNEVSIVEEETSFTGSEWDDYLGEDFTVPICRIVVTKNR